MHFGLLKNIFNEPDFSLKSKRNEDLKNLLCSNQNLESRFVEINKKCGFFIKLIEKTETHGYSKISIKSNPASKLPYLKMRMENNEILKVYDYFSTTKIEKCCRRIVDCPSTSVDVERLF